MLLYQAAGNVAGLTEIAGLAATKGETNIAFTCYFLVSETEKCVDLLVSTKRYPEAAFFAHTYAPRYLFSFI